jgi:hypothetical protein
MRFAVPVLALSLVGVVSYIALRSDKGASTQLAVDAPRQNTASQSAPRATEGLTASTANANTSTFADQNANAAPGGTTATTAQPGAPRGHGSADEARPVVADTTGEDVPPSAPAPAPPAVAATEGPAESSKAEPKTAATEEGEVTRAENRDRSESREKSARGAEQAEEVAVANEAVQRNRAAQTRMGEAQVQMPDGGSRNQKRGADNNTSNVYGGGTAATAAPPKDSERERAAPRTDALGRSRPARRAEKKADDDETVRIGDTRTAAGHRFRREGNAWVDVNYRPSMPSTGVRRGTEAYRALVADVPEVGRVADAIGGEVIVVVGGRAYRIR